MTIRHRKRLAVCVLVGASAMAALTMATRGATPLVLQNVTASLPRGVYVYEPGFPASHAIVAIRQPAAARPYLATLGFPADALLLKRVAAREGDRVCAEAGRVTLPGRVLGRSPQDRAGRRLPSWEGCRVLGRGEVFALGDSAESFDSRYFGPVAASTSVGRYHRWL